MLAEIMPLYYEHDECVKLFMSVDYPQEIPRVMIGKNLCGQDVGSREILRRGDSQQGRISE